MKNGENREVSRAGDAANDIQEYSSGIKPNFDNSAPPITARYGYKSHPTLSLAVYLTILGVFFFAIPDYYTKTMAVPALHELKHSSGVLDFTSNYKTGVRTYLLVNGDREAFTCAVPNWRYQTCLGNEKPFIGKQAEIWWFDLEYYPFLTRPYTMRIDVDGKTILSYEKSLLRVKDLQSDISTTWFYLAISTPIILVVFIFNQWNRRRNHATK